jgi:hypothetical protein
MNQRNNKGEYKLQLSASSNFIAGNVHILVASRADTLTVTPLGVV